MDHYDMEHNQIISEANDVHINEPIHLEKSMESTLSIYSKFEEAMRIQQEAQKQTVVVMSIQ